jgi:NitT/TauT family transport system permease protein
MPGKYSTGRAGLDGAPGQPQVATVAEPIGADPDPEAAERARVTGLDALELAGRADGRALSRFGTGLWRSAWPKVLAVGIFLAVWQVVVLSGWRPEYVLPGPGPVLREFGHTVATGDFWRAAGLTMVRALFGFACAVVIGTVVGVAVSRFRPLRAAIGSLITGLQTMPSIVWFPLAILLFQLNDKAIIFVVIIGAAPSVANGLISGIDYVPRTWLRVGQVLGMRGLARYRHLILPASLPSFVAGLKQGWAFSWRSLMAGELLVIVPGEVSLGVRLQTARDLNDAQSLISYMIIILVIGIGMDVLFNTADNALRRRWGLTGS